MVLALTEEEANEENYLAFSTRLAGLSRIYSRRDNSSFLISVIETPSPPMGRKTPQKKSVARRCLFYLFSPISTLMPDISLRSYWRGETTTSVVKKFLVMSGVQNLRLAL